MASSGESPDDTSTPTSISGLLSVSRSSGSRVGTGAAASTNAVFDGRSVGALRRSALDGTSGGKGFWAPSADPVLGSFATNGFYLSPRSTSPFPKRRRRERLLFRRGN